MRIELQRRAREFAPPDPTMRITDARDLLVGPVERHQDLNHRFQPWNVLEAAAAHCRAQRRRASARQQLSGRP